MQFQALPHSTTRPDPYDTHDDDNVQFMAALPINPLEEKSPTKVEQDNGLERPKCPSRPENRRLAVARVRRNEQSSGNPDAYPPVYWSAGRRKHHQRRVTHSRPSCWPPALVRVLAATRRFIFAEDKTLHEGYTPNYRCASVNFSSPTLVTPAGQVLAYPERPNRPFRHSS